MTIREIDFQNDNWMIEIDALIGTMFGELNNKETRKQIKYKVEVILLHHGITAKVICSSKNNTQKIIDKNDFRVHVCTMNVDYVFRYHPRKI